MFLLLLACKARGEDTAVTQGDDSPEPETCAEDAECGGGQICEDEACITGDRNNAADEAETLLWETAAAGVIQDNGDVDFFTFTAEGGEFIRISTASSAGEEALLNTVVKLYSPGGKLHNQEDEHIAGSVGTYDTVLYAYLPEAGLWILSVEDLDGMGDPSYDYEVVVSETRGNSDESDSFDQPGYTMEEMQTKVFYSYGVLVEEPGDVDYIELQLPYDDCPVTIYGSTHEEGSDLESLVMLYDAEGTPLLQKIDLGPNGLAHTFEVDGGKAILAVTDPDGDGSQDHWAFVSVSIGDRGYSYDAEVEPNDRDSDATPLEWTWDGDNAAAYAWGTLDEEGDEDWYSVEIDEGGWFHLAGTARDFGSLVNASVEVFDENGDSVATLELDADGDFPEGSNIGPLAAGTYTIQVSDAGSDEYGAIAYYRFTAYQTAESI